MRAFLFLLLLAPMLLHAADDAPRLSLRGVEAYRAGRMDLARLFFERSYRQAVLQGRSDWAARAACNLADVALEIRELEEAGRWLEELRPAGSEQVLAGWKRSQLLYLRGRPAEALAALDSAAALGRGDAAGDFRMRLDGWRYRFTLQDSAAWEDGFAAFRRGLKPARRREALGLLAWSRMRRRDFAAAESLWSQAAEFHREERRLLAVGEALAHRALCLHALGRVSEALRSASLAEGVFTETGFAAGRLRAQALQMLLEDGAVAKSAREVDFLSRERGDDWRSLLDEYAQSYPPLLGRLEHLRGR